MRISYSGNTLVTHLVNIVCPGKTKTFGIDASLGFYRGTYGSWRSQYLSSSRYLTNPLFLLIHDYPVTRLHQLPGTFLCKFYSSFVLRSVSLPQPPPTLFRPKPLTIKHPHSQQCIENKFVPSNPSYCFMMEEFWFDFRQDQEIFFFLLEASRPDLGFTQHLFDGQKQLFSPGIKCPKREADHSNPTSAVFENQCIQSHTHTTSW